MVHMFALRSLLERLVGWSAANLGQCVGHVLVPELGRFPHTVQRLEKSSDNSPRVIFRFSWTGCNTF